MKLNVDSRFDAEQRGLMADSSAVEDSLLDGFNDPWPLPSSATALARSGGDGEANVKVESASGDRAEISPGLESDVSRAERQDRRRSDLRVPKGVLLKHAVQVWNALCVLPRPMGLRPQPTLEQLLQAIATLSPRRSDPDEEAYAVGRLVGEQRGEAEFDDAKASIRSTGAGDREGTQSEGQVIGGKEEETMKKDAQALLDGVCISIVRVLSNDLHTVLGRYGIFTSSCRLPWC